MRWLVLVGAWTTLETTVSMQSQASIQRKLNSVSQNLSDFEDMAREPSTLGHEISHAHERAGHAHVINLQIGCYISMSYPDRVNRDTTNFECSVDTT